MSNFQKPSIYFAQDWDDDVYLEGEEKLARKETYTNKMCPMRYWIDKGRNSRTWKNSNASAVRQWARHKPKFHRAWTIGEETCATFLVWMCEDELWRRKFEEMTAREMDRDAEYATDDAEYIAEMEALDELEDRYWYNRLNVVETENVPFKEVDSQFDEAA